LHPEIKNKGKGTMFTLNCKGRLLVLHQPVVMGIINTTPDSFYSNSRRSSADAALAQAEKMLQEGATILDLGGQSTRPGAEQVGAPAEAVRVVPVIEAIHRRFPEAYISVDTYHAAVAAAAVEAGACIVNDVSGGSLDAAMLSTVAQLQVPYICMHMRGTPENMQQHTQYSDVTQEVLDFFIKQTAACRHAGIHDVIVDPGFCFAKNSSQNFQLLRELDTFAILGLPVLAGISRKSMVYKTLGTTAAEALNGSTVLHTLALLKGASILRVHDVKEAVEAVKLVAAYRG
jgi:dihydropteroate synthase